jgi:hypothetical protein
MAKTLIASKLINKVVAQIDRSSFKKAKQEIYRLKKMMDKVSNPIRVAKTQVQQQRKVVDGIKKESRERAKMAKKGGVNLDHTAQKRVLDKNYEYWWKSELKRQSDFQKLFDQADKRKIDADRKAHDARVKQEAAEHKQKVRNAINLRKELNKQRRMRAREQLRRGELAGVGAERFKDTLRLRGGSFRPAEIKQYWDRLNDLNNELKIGSITASTYRIRLNILNSDMRRHSASVKGLSDQYKGLRSAMVAGTASFTAFSAVMSVATIGSQFQRMESMMRVVFGDEATSQMEYLRKEAERLGVTYLDSAKSFAKFAFAANSAGAPLEQVNEIFSSFMEAGVAFGNTPDEMDGIFKALEQMFSKNQIMA